MGDAKGSVMGQVKYGLIATFLCVQLVLAGCSNVEEQGKDQYLNSESTSEAVSEKAELLYAKDYEFLWNALRNNYPYLSYLQTLGIDTDEICSRYEEKITSITDENKFYGTIQDMLSELGNFAHLDVVSPELYKTYCYSTGLGAAVSNEDKAYIEILTNENLSERYIVPRSNEEIEQQAEKDQHNKTFIQYYSDCNALYIKIPSFTQELVDRDKHLISENIEQYPDTEHIIFDISGNSGGSWGYWMNNLIPPFGGHYQFTYRTFYKKSSLFETYHGDLEAVPVSDLSDLPDWVSTLGLDLCITTVFDLSDENYEGTKCNPNIKRWVLTSGTVYSASEAFASFCKTTGWATAVGTKTSGDSLHTTPILIMLPDSGIIIRFSDGVGENPDGSINAVNGTIPDISCKKGETPLARCLEEIRKNSAKAENK